MKAVHNDGGSGGVFKTVAQCLLSAEYYIEQAKRYAQMIGPDVLSTDDAMSMELRQNAMNGINAAIARLEQAKHANEIRENNIISG